MFLISSYDLKIFQVCSVRIRSDNSSIQSIFVVERLALLSSNQKMRVEVQLEAKFTL